MLSEEFPRGYLMKPAGRFPPYPPPRAPTRANRRAIVGLRGRSANRDSNGMSR